MEWEQAALNQKQVRGDNNSEYQIYLACADDGNGKEIMGGAPLKTYEEWLGS